MKNESNFAELVQFNGLNVSAPCSSSSFVAMTSTYRTNLKSLQAKCLHARFVFNAQLTMHGPLRNIKE